MNVRQAANKEIRAWMEANPRAAGESLVAYRRRAKQGIESNLKAKYDGSAWLAILLQLLPLLIELFTKRS